MSDSLNMDAAQTNYSIGQDRSWEKEVVLDSAGSSVWVIIPEKTRLISVTVSFAGGAEGKVQTSTDLVDVVKNGFPVAVDWPFGYVSGNRTEVTKVVSAIRAVQRLSGTMTMTLRAQ